MVIAVVTARVMKMPTDDVVDVVAVLHGLVTAALAVFVLGVVVLTFRDRACTCVGSSR